MRNDVAYLRPTSRDRKVESPAVDQVERYKVDLKAKVDAMRKAVVPPVLSKAEGSQPESLFVSRDDPV